MTRTHLTSDDVDVNHAQWMMLTEQQTRAPFTVEGTALCLAEKITTGLLSSNATGEQVDPGNTYLAATTLMQVLNKTRRNAPCIQPNNNNDASSVEFNVQLANDLIRIARKGNSAVNNFTPEAIMQVCEDIRSNCKKDGNWTQSINHALDCLDRRLMEGYVMRRGSAIAPEDQ